MKEQILCATVATATSCSTTAGPCAPVGAPLCQLPPGRFRSAPAPAPLPGLVCVPPARLYMISPRKTPTTRCSSRTCGQTLFHKTHEGAPRRSRQGSWGLGGIGAAQAVDSGERRLGAERRQAVQRGVHRREVHRTLNQYQYQLDFRTTIK